MMRERRGFTLVELMVTLTIAGVAVAIGAGLVRAVLDLGSRVTAAESELRRVGGADRWLAEAMLGTEVGVEGAEPFQGTGDRLVFTTRLMTADGWAERRRVELHLDGDRLVAVDQGSVIPLMQGVAAVAFDYLPALGADTRWLREWTSPRTAPLGVRLRVERTSSASGGARVDTLLYLVKERG